MKLFNLINNIYVPIIYKLGEPEFRNKIIGLDYDGLLCNPKIKELFHQILMYWVWYSNTVEYTLKQYYYMDTCCYFYKSIKILEMRSNKNVIIH